MDPNRLLGNNDYEDGQIYQLIPGSILDQAIRNEPWLNMTDHNRRRWLRLINGNNVAFVGTVISARRRQVELSVMIVVDPNQPNNRWCVQTMITLADFDRFIGPDPA